MKVKYAVLMLIIIGLLTMPIIGIVTWNQALKYAIIGVLLGGLGEYIYTYFSKKNKK